MMGRRPLADIGVERAWLSTVLVDPSTLDYAPVLVGDLSSKAHALILGAIHALRTQDIDPTLEAVRLELDRTGNLDRAGGDDALLEIAMRTSASDEGGTKQLARRIANLARLRRLAAEFQQGLAAVHEQDLEGAHRVLASMSLDRDSEDEILCFKELLERGAHASLIAPEQGRSLSFGTPSIDRDYSPGPGHLIIVAGRPNVGKTSLTFAWHMHSGQKGIPSGIVSVDDDEAEYGVRGMGVVAGTNPADIWARRLDPEQIARLVGIAGGGQAQYPIHFARIRSKSIEAIEASITRMVRVLGCRWVSVDFLTKIRAPGRDQRERTDEALARLGVLASQLEIPIVVLAQLRRLGPDQFREPHLDDLKESGRIEEDAQAAVLLWRKADKPHEPVQAKLAKVKRAPAGRRFTLQRHPGTGLLVEVDEHQPDDFGGEFLDDDDLGWPV